MDEKQGIIKRINEIVISYVYETTDEQRQLIVRALHTLLNGNYDKYNLIIQKNFVQVANNKKLQNELYKLNEKTSEQKDKGVYYTPSDVCRYIILNSITMSLNKENNRTYKEKDAINYLLKQDQSVLEDLIFKKKFFDPTCGSAEFLLNLFNIKLTILKKIKENYTDQDIYYLAKTIWGNDISEESTDISKIRIFFEITKNLTTNKYQNLIAKVLKSQFTNFDYVLYENQYNNKFDFIIGNPPYVEYGKFYNSKLLTNGFGNIYADVIKNSIVTLKYSGVIGFVLPLSYISTARMSKIRNFVISNTNRQFILNFADRPDCLFQGVHQKLNILIARKGKQEHKLFTSNYRHWYKEEREELLNGCEIKNNLHISDMFIPKIGNDIEESIYKKIVTNTNQNIFNLQNSSGEKVYLNMRACFWIKAFTFNPGSNEYKPLIFSDDYFDYVRCVLNSSLFWLYWTICSDCWHITSKELNKFYLPNITFEDKTKLKILANNLEKALEKTKEFVGSKQTEFEYKHRLCKKQIDDIDDLLAIIYKLNEQELQYIKTFALKYRLGGQCD